MSTPTGEERDRVDPEAVVDPRREAVGQPAGDELTAAAEEAVEAPAGDESAAAETSAEDALAEGALAEAETPAEDPSGDPEAAPDERREEPALPHVEGIVGGPDRPTHVAVVIPAKDEAERIEATVRAAAGIERVDLVVVVDDGSTDATAAIAKGAGAVVVRHRSNQGKAAAMLTGAQLVALRDEAERADGGDRFSEELLAEPRVAGHTGPLPVIGAADAPPRALLFLDGDMQVSAAEAAPLVDAVLRDGVDMAIALLPAQEGAAGFGMVVKTSREGIKRATGWEPQQPLSGTRCMTREVWESCQPLAPGWGVETSLSIDAVNAGFWVKEVPCDLHHRATGKDLRGQLHRAAQLRDVMRALARRRHVQPPEIIPEEPTGE